LYCGTDERVSLAPRKIAAIVDATVK